MAVVTKVQVTSQGRVKAGEFIEADVTNVSVNVASQVKSAGLVEGVTPAQFTKDGVIKASEFVEV